MHTTHRLLLLSAFAATLAACETTKMFQHHPDEQMPSSEDFTHGETPLTGSEFDALWDRAEHVLLREGYGVNHTRTSYVERRMVTHWNTMLAPTRFEGKRTRAWVQFVESAPGEFSVGVAVQVQRNADIDAPTEESQAQWEADGSSPTKAGTILWKIEQGLRPEDDGEAR
jgi:hypothetical protein